MMDETTWMNAKKAVELGFADGMLTDEKRDADEPEAYAFSAKAVDAALINKLNRNKPETKPEGRPVDTLRASLYKKLL